MLLLCLCASSAVFAQEINLSVKNETLEAVFTRLEKQSGYTFFYKIELIRSLPKVTLDIRHASLEKALEMCLQGQPLSFSIVQRTVVIKAKEEPAQQSTEPIQHQTMVIKGRVLDGNGESLPGTTISLKGTRYIWTTDGAGTFTGLLVDHPAHVVLVFSSVGYETKEVAFTPSMKNLVVSMKQSVSSLDEIQTTAYSKTSVRFNTGDITTITSEEIARNPVNNVLDALQEIGRAHV